MERNFLFTFANKNNEMSSTYVVKEELISKEELFEAIDRVKNGPLKVHHTPCIEVINEDKG